MTDHATIVTGLAAGVGGAVLTLLGVDAPTLTAALIGCVFGGAAAKPSGRTHAVCLFAAAVCASAEAGSWLGPLMAHWMPWADVSVWRRIVALGVGVVLHPVTAAAMEGAPRLVKMVVDRMGGSKA